MKRARLTALLAALILLASLTPLSAVAADGTSYEFSDIPATLTADLSGFGVILTPRNLADNAAYFSAQGMDPDAAQSHFAEDGILLQAIDATGGRTLTVTALSDVDGQTYFDLNEQDEEMRRSYRKSHSDGSVYGILGYTYQSASWRNYSKNLGRFLRLKYKLSQNDQSFVGYQRRTIRNGYTITFDLQISGRSLKSADEKFLDKVLSGFHFSDIKSAPLGACKLSVTTDIPKETGSNTLTVKGKTEKNATVTATLISMTSQTTKTFSDTASSKGAYSVKCTFPENGTFSLVISSKTEDGRMAQITYTIAYQRNLLPVSFAGEVPAVLPGDSLTISGATLSGAKTQIVVTGPISYQKTKTGKTFTFNLDTSLAGTYQINILVSKKGLDTRSFTYTAVRTLTEAETMQKIRDSADKVSYKLLKSSAAKYAGQTFGYTGYVIESIEASGEWTVKFALTKSGSTYKDIVYVIAKADPGYAVGEKLKMYGTLSAEPYIEVVEGSGTSEYPKFTLTFFDPAA